MEIITQRADLSAATMPALPQLALASTAWQQKATSRRFRADAPAQGNAHPIAMSYVGLGFCGADAARVQDAAAPVGHLGADTKFSTRLGPTASPPV